MPGLHSLYQPSSADRWLSCPGSLDLESKIELEPEASSEYAAEGSAAHQLAEECLTLGTYPFDSIGKEISFVDDDGSTRTFPVTEEMAQAVQVFLDVVDAEFRSLEDGVLESEVRHAHKLCPDFGGTTDALVYGHDRESGAFCLSVIDLKYGKGVPVDVIGNKQLLSYSTINISNLVEVPDRVRLIVVQPRASHVDGPVRSWEPDRKEIALFEEEVLGLLRSDSRDETLKSGSHCRWCPVKPFCPELKKTAEAFAKEDFATVEALYFAQEEAETTDSAGSDIGLTPADINKILEMEEVVSGYFDSVSKLRHRQMMRGVKFPGHKLVNRYGHRKFDLVESELLKKLRSRGFGKKDVTATKVLTPAQMEKLPGMEKSWLNSFCVSPVIGTSVVPESNGKKAVEPNSADNDFKDIKFDDISKG